MHKLLTRALEENKSRLLATNNVIGIGIGYKTVNMQRTKELAIIVLVEKKVPLLKLMDREIIPQSIDSVKTDVIEIGKIRLLNQTSRIRPAQPGISIGHYQVSAGTFGGVVTDKETGLKMILSNNHVLANATSGTDKRSSIGDPILQPGNYDGGLIEDQIAVLHRFVPLAKEEEEATCLTAEKFCKILNWLIQLIRPYYQIKVIKKVTKENLVDCAIAKPLKEDLIAEEILQIGAVNGSGKAVLGMEVKKSGRTSGLTKGKVLAVGVSLRVPIGPGENVIFSDQVITDMVSRPGDSGSFIVDEENRAVGLLFAGSHNVTVFNRLEHVLRLLKVEV